MIKINNDLTVTDTETGIIWMRNIMGSKINLFDSFTWEESNKLCVNGWRLPTALEFSELYGKVGDILLFHNNMDANFWTSNEFLPADCFGSGSAYCFDTYSRTVFFMSKDYRLRVRLVRETKQHDKIPAI